MPQGFTHETTATATPVEWYTPLAIFQALNVMFDLDPCAAPRFDAVPAVHKYRLPTDGLRSDWFGNVWVNPPYGVETKRWLKKLVDHGEGIALVFARTDTRWFQQTAAAADTVCFVSQRIKFINGLTGDASGTPGAGSALIAFGSHNAESVRRSNLGLCMSVNNL